MKYIKLFEDISSWYRGYTKKTTELPYLWLTKSKKHANVYADMNTIIYGGDKKVSEYEISLDDKNTLDLSEYDMNDKLEEYEFYDILNEIDDDIDDDFIIGLFDLEEEIPLSRMINNILDKIMKLYDVLKIKEDGYLTLCINKSKLYEKNIN